MANILELVEVRETHSSSASSALRTLAKYEFLSLLTCMKHRHVFKDIMYWNERTSACECS